MKILVVSDTHIPIAADSLPTEIEKEAKNSDCCLHCGDFVDYSVFKTLNRWTKTYGVQGNMDNLTVRKNLPAKLIIKFEDITLGLTHGCGNPNNLIDYINKEFSEEFITIDIFVFGHSHLPFDKEINGKIYFNPGSLTDKVFTPYNSYGILNIKKNKIKRSIVKIE